MGKRTFHQVMSIFRVPRDSPLKLSNSEIILDDSNYETSSFEAFVIIDTIYVTWFLQSLIGPIIDDFPMSSGRVLGGIARSRWVSEPHLRLHVDTLRARVIKLKGPIVAREGHAQEEIARSLARESEHWQRKREMLALLP